MIKDQETRKWLGIVFVLRDDFVSSLSDDEFEKLKPIFEQLELDVLTLENGPYPIGTDKRRKVCENNDIILADLYNSSPDKSKEYVLELQKLNDRLKVTTKV